MPNVMCQLNAKSRLPLALYQIGSCCFEQPAIAWPLLSSIVLQFGDTECTPLNIGQLHVPIRFSWLARAWFKGNALVIIGGGVQIARLV